MQNTFKMIDVGDKPITHRVAVASGEISVGAGAFKLIRDKELPKGDALILAEIAGITGAKKAYEMIPLCHPMGLDYVKIITELDAENHKIIVTCFASTHAKTGIEMEALAGVKGALLTIWDLTKMVEPNLNIGNVRLLAKSGGKKGLWLNPNGVSHTVLKAIQPQIEQVLSGRKSVVITLSDRASRGEYEDQSGVILKEILLSYGAEISDYAVIPDDKETIKSKIQSSIKSLTPDLIICTGGTGVSKRDVTPEAVGELFEKKIPGVGELIRSDGAKYTTLSWSSRAVAGIVGKTLIVTLPGNPKAVREAMSALMPKLIPHLIKITQNLS
ncbi:MAG: bifunctional molybdenum cofactor biosynthesis protein MoaC/MoaB [Alphaproteobacteria bacterium RIFCSPLOWO2_01_FULL_40_26]|nr:MAG: bifunctional molybdenum cofactor biosynthesis protein MoaC/MoaB [Alphaproteobacteria bacterium RIFCSPHIGHO2_02_FULL_40_34]OFW85472.1 MAG: bifunctional molybdenum cofactor biosynthesis protein MoaC/MoaB [Alphaproteobacteria bacterium RIFCSPHIGHO2_01_FULL_40_8]OFW94782.1 MAG: bifunctional molybdenum cofactor biosynthesis protein MoaC/MoaB [Alphaproteobacteria bacterium RIFCSPLOWO2_01_FULL_40_26]OFX10411.1 MAG: bifunctional molybdenum cofactor biosynthesis protein MoaC/MoaB [Alphaproteobact